ncbi:hypothetical protein PIROE2DRAFT_6794 [Piromyces sp. E2]|nr:hypothetical protein PIROE2DRAFT_6794 [Piromyces sp. E2]|eukprot:OUM66082.1 hypothetical protein PIROE2DRAFT_6794 [Piromyces sp. E2]
MYLISFLVEDETLIDTDINRKIYVNTKSNLLIYQNIILCEKFDYFQHIIGTKNGCVTKYNPFNIELHQ